MVKLSSLTAVAKFVAPWVEIVAPETQRVAPKDTIKFVCQVQHRRLMEVDRDHTEYHDCVTQERYESDPKYDHMPHEREKKNIFCTRIQMHGSRRSGGVRSSYLDSTHIIKQNFDFVIDFFLESAKNHYRKNVLMKNRKP